jgi:hypothetical protein
MALITKPHQEHSLNIEFRRRRPDYDAYTVCMKEHMFSTENALDDFTNDST